MKFDFTKRESILYNLLEDGLSKRIFLARKRWVSMFGKESEKNSFPFLINNELFVDVVSLPDYLEVANFVGIENRIRTGSFVLWGYGQNGKRAEKYCYENGLIENLVEIWDASVDNEYISSYGVIVKNPKTYDVNSLLQFDFVLVGVVDGRYTQEILNTLADYGVSSNKILFIDWQDNLSCYFDTDIILPRLHKTEAFVDGGCYDASTSLRLLDLHPETKHIFAFEPDKQNFSYAQQVFAKLRAFDKLDVRTSIQNAALYFEEGSVSFWETNTGTSAINATADNYVPALRLDSAIPQDIHLSFIKLDIEGSELDAVRGAVNTIKGNKPKLAISVYHKPFDYVDILEYIYSIVPEYKFYLRHYGARNYETVLYCVV